MQLDDYRFFITRVVALEAETKDLRRALAVERASFDELIQASKQADRARLAERAAYERRVKAMSRRKWLPGVIGGVAPSRGGSGVQGVIGLGWKVNLW